MAEQVTQFTEPSQEFFESMANKSAFRIEKVINASMRGRPFWLIDWCEAPVHCGYEDAYGDQCESCGQTLNLRN